MKFWTGCGAGRKPDGGKNDNQGDKFSQPSSNRLRSLYRQAVSDGDMAAAETIAPFMVDAPSGNQTGTTLKQPESPKRNTAEFSPRRHGCIMSGTKVIGPQKNTWDIARVHVDDPRFCVRVIHEVQDLDYGGGG